MNGKKEAIIKSFGDFTSAGASNQHASTHSAEGANESIVSHDPVKFARVVLLTQRACQEVRNRRPCLFRQRVIILRSRVCR